MPYYRILLLIFCSFIIAISQAGESYTVEPNIRVRIGKNISSVTVKGTDLSRIIHLTKDKKFYRGRRAIKFDCHRFLKKEKYRGKPVLLATVDSPTGLLSVKGEHYHGKIHVVTGRGYSCDVINETGLENYISSLLAKEMNASWHLEALKAQAIAARTYAVFMMKSDRVSREAGSEAFYHLESSEKHQVGGSFFDATKKTVQATKETRGYILKNVKSFLTPIFYHAKCGGRTLLPQQVWSSRVLGYSSVQCPFCHHYGDKYWRANISRKRANRFFSWLKKNNFIDIGTKLARRSKIRVAKDKFSRNHVRIYFGGRAILVRKALFRRYFGRNNIPSNNFKLSTRNGTLRLVGKGLGHGVGMCQLGALRLSRNGYDFERILAHYFPGHKMKRVY